MLIHNSRHIVIPALAGLRVHTPRGGAAAAWWQVAGVTCLVAYQAKGASSYAASKSNLAQPGTYDAADGAAYPTWDAATGWTFNGSDQYLNTGYTPTWSHTIAVQYTNLVGNVAVVWGASSNFLVQNWFNTGIRFYLVNGKIGSTPVLNGNLVLAGGGANNGIGYSNGVQDQTGLCAGNMPSPGTCFIGGNNNGGVLQNAAAMKVQAWAAWSSQLSAAQVATVSAAMAAL